MQPKTEEPKKTHVNILVQEIKDFYRVELSNYEAVELPTVIKLWS